MLAGAGHESTSKPGRTGLLLSPFQPLDEALMPTMNESPSLRPACKTATSSCVQALAILIEDSIHGRSQQQLDFELAVAALRSAGIATKAMPGVPDPEMEGAASQPSPRLVYLHFPILGNIAIATKISAIYAAMRPRPVLLAGGRFSSESARFFLQSLEEVDAVAFGEIEETLAGVVRGLESGAWRDEPGLWRRRGRVLDRTAPRPLIEDLDILPTAAADFAEAGTTRQILVGRGCNSSCSYCGLQTPAREAFPARERFWRSRSSRQIADEMEWLCRQRGIDRFVLNSHVLLGYDEDGTRWVEGLVQEILTRRLEVHFSFVTHPDHLWRNRHLLPALREAGMSSILLGIDSILDRARRLFGVPFTAEDIRKALASVHEHKIDFRTLYIFYDPYLSLDEVDRHLAFFRSVRPLYGHLGSSYGAILHQQVFTSALQLSYEMPILGRLREDGLLIEETPFERRPISRFREPATGRFASLHRLFNRQILQIVAPLVLRAEMEAAFPDLAFFLIDALAEIRRRIVAEPDLPDGEMLMALRLWTQERLTPVWAGVRDSEEIPSPQRGALEELLSGLD